MATSFNPGRRHSSRLWVVFVGAILLVTLPVLPLSSKIFGFDVPDFSTALNQAGQWAQSQLASINPSLVPNKNAATPSLGSSEDVKLLDQAAQQLLVEITKNPTNPSLHNRLGLIYAEIGDMKQAEAYFQEAIALSRKSIVQLEEMEAQGRAAKDFAKASNAVLQTSALNVELSAAHSNLIRVYEKMGMQDRLHAQLDEMNKDITIGRSFNQTAKATPTSEVKVHKLSPQSMTLLARAQGYMQAHNYREAMKDLRSIISMDPNIAIAHQQLGMAAWATRNLFLAAQEFQTSLKLNPDDYMTHNVLGLVYQAQGKVPLARKEFSTAFSLNPQDASPALHLGNSYAAKGEYAQAATAFRQAIQANPNSAVAHTSLGSVMQLAGDPHTAIEEFEQALSIDPAMASAHYGIGLALFHMGEYGPSIQAFKRAVTLDPGLIDCHHKIDIATRKAGHSATLAAEPHMIRQH